MADENEALEGVAEPQPAPEGQAPPPEGAAMPAGAAPDGQAPAPAPTEPKPAKGGMHALQGRVGYLTKTLNERDAALAEERRRNEALSALLSARPDGAPPPAALTSPPAQPAYAPNSPEFQQAVRAEAARQQFESEANRVNAEGREKLGQSWDDALGALNAMGLLQQPFVEAAMASGDPVGVLSALGQDLDEASRLASLPPVRMAAEITRMANKPAPPAPAAPALSRAPAPITPVSGAVTPTVDIYDPRIAGGDTVSDDFLRARAKAGSPWYQRHKNA